MLYFGCGRQQKPHAAPPPPSWVRRRMEGNRQKLVGQDKDSLTANKGNRNNNDTDKEKTQHKPHNPQSRSLSRTGPVPVLLSHE